MAVYPEDGHLKTNHDDTAEYGPSGGERPHKVEWKTKKQSMQEGCLKSEFSTRGTLPSYLDRKEKRFEGKFGAGLAVICIASPIRPHSIMRFIVYKDAANKYTVRRVL
jgi:hypothetical protein